MASQGLHLIRVRPHQRTRCAWPCGHNRISGAVRRMQATASPGRGDIFPETTRLLESLSSAGATSSNSLKPGIRMVNLCQRLRENAVEKSHRNAAGMTLVFPRPAGLSRDSKPAGRAEFEFHGDFTPYFSRGPRPTIPFDSSGRLKNERQVECQHARV
jgi:hypothetical protein